MVASFSTISLMETLGGDALDKAAERARISRRSAQVLALLVAINAPTYTNQDLQNLFVECKLSTKLSAPKEASICKSALLIAGYIETRGKVSTIAVTKKGYRAVTVMDWYVARVLQGKMISDRVRTILLDVPSVTGEQRHAENHPRSGVSKLFVVRADARSKTRRHA